MRFGNNLGNGIGAEMQAYLDKTLLTNIVDNTVFDRLATMQRPLPLRNTKEIKFDKWVRMQDIYFANAENRKLAGLKNPDGTDQTNNEAYEVHQMLAGNEYTNFILDEGSSGASKAQMKIIQQSTSVFAIGDWMPFTEEMEMFHNRWSVAETTKQMGEMSGLIIDGYYRDLYLNGAGHFIDDSNVDISSSDFTKSCRQMVTGLKLSGAKPVNAMMSASANYGTTPVKARYTAYFHPIGAETIRQNPDFVPVEKYGTGKEMDGEVGTIGQIRFIENSNAPVTESGSDFIIDIIVVGQDHTAHVPVRGKGSAEVVVKALGESGSDPLNRAGTVGWKSWLGAKVLHPERLGVIKVKATR